MATNNKLPTMVDLDPIIAAGINPKTGLPIKAEEGGISCISKTDIKKQLRILDEQDAINRFTWYNLPNGLNSRLIERILYYRGQGMFFKMDEKYFFLPYALNGTIDVYGRYTEVTPLPFNGKSTPDGKEKPFIEGLTRKCMYDVVLPETFISEEGEILWDKIEEMQDECCVLLKDYSEQQSQANIPRQILQEPILDVMSEIFPFLRTTLLNATGVDGMRVNSQDESANVELASKSINNAALTGKKWIPVIGNIDFQELTSKSVAKAEEFLLTMQSLDNYRLSLYGLDNGGLFQKKSHILEAEQQMNTGTTGLVMRDGLSYRQDFSNIVNSIFGLGIWCEPSEVVMGVDYNQDGMLGSNEDEGTNGTTGGTSYDRDFE